MKLLVDTHVWLWSLFATSRLSEQAKELLVDPRNELFLSAASSWEIAIKHALGKLQLPDSPERYVPSRMRASGVTALPITVAHSLAIAGLPRLHSDPFDRLLLAQAKLEDLTLLTADPAFKPYGVPLIWAAK